VPPSHPELVDAGQTVAGSPFGPRRRWLTFQWILLAGCDDRSTSHTAAKASIRRPTDSIGESATGINVQNRPGGAAYQTNLYLGLNFRSGDAVFVFASTRRASADIDGGILALRGRQST
jgi:hypothetical protein